MDELYASLLKLEGKLDSTFPGFMVEHAFAHYVRCVEDSAQPKYLGDNALHTLHEFYREHIVVIYGR